MCSQIADVKAKISAEKGWEADKQKLIYSGTRSPRNVTRPADCCN